MQLRIPYLQHHRQISTTVEVDSSATMADECIFNLDGEVMHSDYSWTAETYQFSIDVDELVDFELYSQPQEQYSWSH